MPPTPSCTWKMKTTTNAPWNEKSTPIAFTHLIQHTTGIVFNTLRRNKITFCIILFLVCVLTAITIINQPNGLILAATLFPIGATIIGLGVRDAIHEIRVESLQAWLEGAYRVHVDYLEALLILTAFYYGVESFTLSTRGTLERGENGLIYKEPA